MPFVASSTAPYGFAMTVLVRGAVLLVLWSCTVKARVPLSVGVIALGAFTFLRVDGRAPYLHVWAGARQAFKGYFHRADYWLPALLFVGYLLSAAWSENGRFLGIRLQLSAQAIGIPAAFWILRPLLRPWRKQLLTAFVGFSAIAAAGVMVYYALNESALFYALGRGRAIPVPNGHVRFAMALSMASLAGLYVSLSDRSHLRYWAGAAAVVSAAAVHVLAVRTGLVCLYLGVALLLVRWVQPRYGWYGVLGVGGVLATAVVVAVLSIPPLSQKLRYVKYDLERLGQPVATNNSDGGRWLSIATAASIVQDHPFGGAPHGDLPGEMQKRYRAAGHSGVVHLPHNQVLFTWSTAGLVGLLGVLAAIIGPLCTREWWRVPLLAEYSAVIILLCLVEAPFESDVGIALCFTGLYLAKLYERGDDAS